MAIKNTAQVLHYLPTAMGTYGTESGTTPPVSLNLQAGKSHLSEFKNASWRHRCWTRHCAVLLASLCCVLAGRLHAQTQSPPERLTQAQIKEKYQNCPSGYYSGPRPGKTRFAQDPWLWVVTPEFARRFCMPPEFVSTELKGAEAVAFRLMQKTDEVNCGFGNNAQACFGERVLRFEIYIRSDQALPRRREGRIYQLPRLPSALLIAPTSAEMDATSAYIKANPEPSSLPHFSLQQVALQGVRNGVVEWPITALQEEIHRGGIFEGIDYYAFEGSTGNFRNPRMLKEGIKKFQISFKPLNEKSVPSYGRKVSEFAHAIELPEAFANAISEMDRTRGTNTKLQIEEAFNVKPAPQSAQSVFGK